MSDPLRDRVIAAVGDLYDIDEEIGRGGMAVVYRATDVRLKRRVAIKVLPPDLGFRADVRTRFLREAETAAKLNHPNIVPIHSVDERGGLVYFVMALVDGESLATRLKRDPRPPVSDVRRIMRDVADALAYAHAKGVIHRDIKPDNILLERISERAVVTDFGIAWAAEVEARITVTGVAMGTPAYMSPEQATGERTLDGRSDVYSLGVVGYLMLTGTLPFEATSTAGVLMKHLSETPRAISEQRRDVPSALISAVERSLAKHADDRPDAAGLRDMLTPESELPRGLRQEAPRGAKDEPPRGSREDAWKVGLHPLRQSSPEPPSSDKQEDAPGHANASEVVVPTPAREWKRQRAEQKRLERERRRQEHDAVRNSELPPARRVALFRRNVVTSGSTLLMLSVINALTSPHFPWVIFPILGIGNSLVRQWSGLWADGITWRQILRPAPPPVQPAPIAAASLPPAPAVDPATGLVPSDVLAGPQGGAVRRAAADRAQILTILDSLAPADRELLPEIRPTVQALLERTCLLAQVLHHLDRDVSAGSLAHLADRIATVQAEPPETFDHERRLNLLMRQQATMKELEARRATVSRQLESAALALQNLKLDLIKLRSSGVQSAIADVTSATREARALSKEIGNILDAAAEVRKL